MRRPLQWGLLALAIFLVVGIVGMALYPRNGKQWLHDFRADRVEVQPDQLIQMIERADKIVVLAGPDQDAAVLFQSSERKDLDDLKSAFVLKRPENGTHCMCDGAPAMVLYAAGKRIGQLTNHHGKLLRCNLWESDAEIVDTESYLKWFDDRNIPWPRQEYESAEKRRKES